MADVVDDIFASANHPSEPCPECKVVAGRLRTLIGKSKDLKDHLHDIVNDRGVRIVLAGGAHFEATSNTLTVPHSGLARDADDLLDALIFESYNAIRKDQFTAATGFLDQHRIRDHGVTTATIECGTMADFYALAKDLDEDDRTTNMRKCLVRAAQAPGDVNAYFLALPHESDPVKRAQLPPGDERRLPTRDTYIYQNIKNRTNPQIRSAILKVCNVDFREAQQALKWGSGTKTTVEVTGGVAADSARLLMPIVERCWPSVSHDQRPWALLEIIDLVQNDARFQPLRGHLTRQAFGYSPEMSQLARDNRGTFAMKA